METWTSYGMIYAPRLTASKVSPERKSRSFLAILYKLVNETVVGLYVNTRPPSIVEPVAKMDG